MLANSIQQIMDFLCFYVCCVLRGLDTGDFDSSGALGSVSFRCNNSRCQVPFQSCLARLPPQHSVSPRTTASAMRRRSGLSRLSQAASGWTVPLASTIVR